LTVAETEGAGAGKAGPEAEARTRRVSDGIKQGLGVPSALKDALEEAIGEARERGDLTPDRAREAVRSALHRVQEAAGDAKERLDFVPRKEFDHLRDQLEELKVRLENLERRAAQGPGAGPSRPEAEGSG
jgi:polyhydroxyalkanoate synthesis regulator phasin